MTVIILGANSPSLLPLIGFCIIPRAYSVEMQFVCFTLRRRNKTNALSALTCVQCAQPPRRKKLTVYRLNKQVEILKSVRCSKSQYTWRKSVQFSLSVMSHSLQPHESQHIRPPCPSPTPEPYSNSCSFNRWCHPTNSPSVIPFSCPQSFPSIKVFSNESALHIRWPKHSSFSFSISPCNEYSGLISFRMDCLDLLAVQGTLKSLLQHHSSKASIIWCSAFFTVQLSHPYMTTRKTIALTRQNFIDNVMSLLFNMLSRLVIAFIPRSKCLSVSWLKSPSAVILEPPKIKSLTVSIVSLPCPMK